MSKPSVCDLCRSSASVVVGRRDRRLRPLLNVLCLDCGLIRQDPMPDDAALERYYARDYRLQTKGVLEPSRYDVARDEARARARLRVIEPLLPANARLLDVGSGNGIFLRHAREHGCCVQGIEPNVGYAEWGRRRYGVDAVIGGWSDADFAPGSFDFITSHHVMEHLRSPAAAFAKFHEWLAPGGHLYVSVPNLADPAASPINRFQFAHLHGFSHETLIMMGLKAGFRCVAIPRTRNTKLVFERLAAPPADWLVFPDHGRALEAFLREHSAIRYLFKPIMYRGWAKKVANKVRMHMASAY